MIKGINHIGMSVSNLDRAMSFYYAALGAVPLNSGRTFDPNYEEGKYQLILGLRGAAGRVRMIGVDHMRIELFEFSHPRPKVSDPTRPVCDHGITHFCVEVEDIECVSDRILAAGGTLHCRPIEFFGMVKAVYARDPDGNVFELIEPLRA